MLDPNHSNLSETDQLLLEVANLQMQLYKEREDRAVAAQLAVLSHQVKELHERVEYSVRMLGAVLQYSQEIQQALRGQAPTVQFFSAPQGEPS